MLDLKVLFFIYFISLMFFVNGLVPQSNSGKYFETNLDRFDVLYENKTISEWNLKVRKINKTRSIVGYVWLKVPFGDDYKTDGKILKKQGGEYRFTPYEYSLAPFCTLWANDKYVYQDLAKMSDLPADIMENCPLKTGNYSFYGVSFSLDNAPRMIFSSGDYATEFTYYDPDNNIVGKYRIYLSIIQI